MNNSRFASVKTFILFVGHARSGSTVMGEVISMHPNAVIANELNIFRSINHGLRSRTKLFRNLLKAGFHKDYTELKVIGDKKASASAGFLDRNPECLGELSRLVGTTVRVITPVRNPFDNIATMNQKSTIRKGLTLDESIEIYKRNLRGIEVVKESGLDQLFVRLEDLIASPDETLKILFGFSELDGQVIEQAKATLYTEANITRGQVDWSPSHIEEVNRLIKTHPHLEGYSYEL